MVMNLEELKDKQKELYEKLLKIKQEEKDLILKLHDLKSKEMSLKLYFLNCDNQIAILELMGNKSEKYLRNENLKIESEKNAKYKNYNQDKINLKNSRMNEKSNAVRKLPDEKIEAPKEYKSVFLEEFFEEFQRKYYTSFRSMMALSIRNETAMMLNKLKYADWENKYINNDIFLQASGSSNTYRAEEVEKDGNIYCIVAPPPDINLSETDIVQYALDKFFELEGDIVPNNSVQKQMEIIMPAVFVKRLDNYYELKQRGSLKFE